MDEMFLVIDDHKTESVYKDLKQMVVNQDYDTDCLKLDVTDKYDGNINPMVFGKEIPTKIWKFIQEVSCMIYAPTICVLLLTIIYVILFSKIVII